MSTRTILSSDVLSIGLSQATEILDAHMATCMSLVIVSVRGLASCLRSRFTTTSTGHDDRNRSHRDQDGVVKFGRDSGIGGDARILLRP